MIKEVKNYKLKTLPSNPIPDAILYIKADGDTEVTVYVTDVNGVPYLLKDEGGIISPGVQSVFNTDGTISVVGIDNVKISLHSSLLTLINSALQSGDNITELTNNAGYITIADIPAQETNLQAIASPSQVVINNDNGTSATILPATTINAGVLTPTDKVKLNNLSGVNTGDQDLSNLVVKNAPITGSTKTKITYDTKGLVIEGADATTADINDSLNRRYVTDLDKIDINNLSGVNSGDQNSIVGISGTKSQYNTSLTDGDFLFIGDVVNYTDEQAQDAVGTILTDSTTIDLTYDDVTPTITAIVKPNSITPTELADNINLTEFVNNAGFENTAQLNVRDTNNRNRANHTGTQAISTVVNLQPFLDAKENKVSKNVANGYAGLGSDGKLFNNQLPALAITDTFVVNSQSAMLALSLAETGDIAVRTDLNETYILKGTDPSIIIDWQELLTPTDSVSSVFGRTGNVVANSGDYNTSLVPDTLNKRYVTDANLITIGNQSGINTGDETIATIQAKRPIKTINTISLEGTGNATVSTDNIPNASSVTGATTSNALNTLNTNKIDTTEKGVINGVATLDINGKVPLSQIPTIDSHNPIYYKGKDIHWFGDSYTSGSGALPTANRFTTIVSSALGANEINHGVAGTTMQKRVPINYMASPNMVDNVVNIPTKIASKAMLVFAFGLNDMGQTAPAYSTANYKTDYQTVLNNAFSKGWLPNQILIIPAYYIGSAGYAAYATLTGNSAPTLARHLDFIQAAKEVSELNNTMYFDIYQDQKKNDITLIGADNIHPTNAGYAYIANDVLQYLGQDKLSITSDTGYSSGVGFISKINGNKIDNSFIYQNTSGIGIATKNVFTTMHLSSVLSATEMQISNTTSTDAINRGASIILNGNNLTLVNRENGYFNLGTNNVGNIRIHASGGISINGITDPGANNLNVSGITSSTGAFQVGAPVPDSINRFISFPGASNVTGFSYFAGTSGLNGASSFGLHFTGATSALSPFNFGINGEFKATGNVTTIPGVNTNHAATVGQLNAAVATAIANTVTAASTLTLTVAPALVNYYVFTGTTSTWTLPIPSGNATKKLALYNTGTGTITINTNGGANVIYNGGVPLVNTYASLAGSNIELYSDGTKWIVI